MTAANEQTESDARHNGQWWLSISKRQRNGFAHGFVTCYLQLVNRATFKDPYSLLSNRLTEYLQAHPEALAEPAESNFLKVNTPPYAKPTNRKYIEPNESSEELDQKWGPHDDGDEWLNLPPEWSESNLGYIQGFLACYRKYTKQENGTFSKPAEWYVKKISEWYSAKDSSTDEKIPAVLFHFRDR